MSINDRLSDDAFKAIRTASRKGKPKKKSGFKNTTLMSKNNELKADNSKIKSYAWKVIY